MTARNSEVTELEAGGPATRNAAGSGGRRDRGYRGSAPQRKRRPGALFAYVVAGILVVWMRSRSWSRSARRSR